MVEGGSFESGHVAVSTIPGYQHWTGCHIPGNNNKINKKHKPSVVIMLLQ